MMDDNTFAVALAKEEQATSRTVRALMQAWPAVDAELEKLRYNREERTFLGRAMLIMPDFVHFVAGPHDAKPNAAAIAKSLTNTPLAKLVEQNRADRNPDPKPDPFAGMSPAQRIAASRKAGA